MKDSVIFGSGNSRYLKSVENFKALYPTYDDFAAALVAGTLPIDLNGINAAGFQQLGDALGKATLLKDETAASYGLSPSAVVDDVLSAIKGKIIFQHTMDENNFSFYLPDDLDVTKRHYIEFMPADGQRGTFNIYTRQVDSNDGGTMSYDFNRAVLSPWSGVTTDTGYIIQLYNQYPIILEISFFKQSSNDMFTIIYNDKANCKIVLINGSTSSNYHVRFDVEASSDNLGSKITFFESIDM